MEISKLVIAMAQLNSNDDVARNLAQVSYLIESINKPVDIVFFPENSLFFRIIENDLISYLELDSKEFKYLAQLSEKKNIYIHLGSVALMEKTGPVNASILISPDQKIIRTYSKIHLFDIQLNQEKAIRESDCFSRGEKPAVFTLKGWRFGQSICYDIRFSELYRFYSSLNVDVLLVPSAFLKKTGDAHWHILNRARAIESQAFVVSSAQMGPHNSIKEGAASKPRETYGHSLCVSPWGDVLAEIKNVPALQIIELNKTDIENVKKQIPMAGHRFKNAGSWVADEFGLD